MTALLGAGIASGIPPGAKPKETSPRGAQKTGSNTESKAGMELIRIPGGSYRHGCEPADSHCFEDEKPGRRATVKDFRLARTPATVESWAGCVAAGACTAPQVGGSCNWKVAGREKHPVNCIDWNQASAFCRWQGLRLPTTEEWEYAAKGGEARVYPWGNAAVTAQRANFCEKRCFELHIDWTWTDRSQDDGWQSTSPVGTYPAGASRHGLLDMAGNAAQWTASDYSPGFKEVRGGGWDQYPRYLRASTRVKHLPNQWFDNVTVRCAE